MRMIDADALIAELQKDEERFDKEAEDCRKNSRNYTDCYMQAMSSRADGIRDAIVEVYDAPSIEPNLILPEQMGRGDIYEVGETIVVMNHDDYYDLLCKSWMPKRGEWIVYEGEWKDFDYYPPKCKCNQCGYEEELYILNAKPTNFCPNCGARMVGEREGE